MSSSSPHDPDKMLCYCLGVRYGVVEQTIREHGCRSVEEVTAQCKAGGGCKSCHPEIEEVLEHCRRGKRSGGLFARLGFGRKKGSR